MTYAEIEVWLDKVLKGNKQNFRRIFKAIAAQVNDTWESRIAKLESVEKSISELQAYTGDAIRKVYVYDPLKYGFFKFDPDDTTSADDGVLILVTADGKRYKRVCDSILPRYFGAYGNGDVYDTDALNDFFDYYDRGTLDLEGKKYKVNGTLYIQDKNVASANPDYDNPNVSSLVVHGNGDRIFSDSLTDEILTIQRCKRTMINDLQIDGITNLSDCWESNFVGFFSRYLRFNPFGLVVSCYNNKFDTSTIGAIKMYIGTIAAKSEVNQNFFINTKVGYGLGDDIEVPIQVYGSYNAQSNTFYSCDIYAPTASTVLSVDEQVNDVSFIFVGSTYFDKGQGFPKDLKGVRIYNHGLFVDPIGNKFDYTTLENASRTPMHVTSHPNNGSRVSHAAVNLIKNGNFRDDVDPSLNVGFTPSYITTAPLHNRILRLLVSTAGDKYFSFDSVVIPFTGTYSLSVIGKRITGSIGTVWSYFREGSWHEVQYGPIEVAENSIPTWDGLTVELQAGDVFKIMFFTSVLNTDIYLYDVSLILGSESLLYAPVMHPNASAALRINAIGSTPNANGLTLSGSTLNLEPANQTYGGIITAALQLIGGVKYFVAGLFATRGVTYNNSANMGVEIGSSNGDCVNETLPFSYRWYVKGDALGQLLYLQVKKCVYVAGVYHPELEVWADTGVELDINGNWKLPNQKISTGDGKVAIYSDPTTNERGFLLKVINRTGETSVKGKLVSVSTAADNEVILQANEYDTFGVIQESGIAQGSEMFIWVSGSICQVMFKDGVSVARGEICIAADTDGRADRVANPGSGLPGIDVHFKECGHIMQTVGSGTNILALVTIHFN